MEARCNFYFYFYLYFYFHFYFHFYFQTFFTSSFFLLISNFLCSSPGSTTTTTGCRIT